MAYPDKNMPVSGPSLDTLAVATRFRLGSGFDLIAVLTRLRLRLGSGFESVPVSVSTRLQVRLQRSRFLRVSRQNSHRRCRCADKTICLLLSGTNQ
jgi:hypothetical protein